MKTLHRLLLTTLAATFIVGCATTGAKYDDTRIAKIKRGETTEAQLIQWFGPPTSRNMDSSGRSTITWDFGGSSHTQARHNAALNVALGTDGTVDAYSAHARR